MTLYLPLRTGEYGATVIVTDIDEAGARATADQVTSAGGTAFSFRLDVSERDAVEALIEDTAQRHGRLDYLFNNAGIAQVDEVRDMSLADWQRMIDIDQMGVLYGTLAAYRIMCAQGSGHIVNTASVAGLVPTPLLTAYSMTKHAVVGLSTSLREEAAGLGVKVSVVCPGLVRTRIADGDFSRHGHFPDPFALVRERMKISPITPLDAADYILKGVAKNQSRILFPSHAKTLVRMHQLVTTPMSTFARFMLKEYRQTYRTRQHNDAD